jgi:hypothetical protein
LAEVSGTESVEEDWAQRALNTLAASQDRDGKSNQRIFTV